MCSSLPPGRVRRSPAVRDATCQQCAVVFSTTHSRTKYCSTKCEMAYRRAHKPLSDDQKEKARKRAVAWYAENKASAMARIKAWRAQNKDLTSVYGRKWSANNKDSTKANTANRRALIKERPGKITKRRVNELFVLQRGKCPCCRASLDDGYHLDHIMPLALGGDNTNGNLQLLCPACNLSKRAIHPTEFMQQRGFLL